ncbi:hypothetical protein Tco_0817795 [Tanacetum coccineum]
MGFETKAKGKSDGKAKEKILCSVIGGFAAGQVRVLHVPSRYQFADIFTKGLPSALFEEFNTSLSVRCPPAPTAGEFWIDDTQLSVMFSRIYALEINKDCTVADKLQFSVTSSLRRSVRGGVESSQLALLQTYIEGG